jgi:hypothetical protein
MEFAKPAIQWTADEATKMLVAATNNSAGPGGIFPQVSKGHFAYVSVR